MNMTAAPSPDASRPYARIRTTLYDLMAAINTAVGPENEQAVVAIVVRLLSTGQITFLGELESSN